MLIESFTEPCENTITGNGWPWGSIAALHATSASKLHSNGSQWAIGSVSPVGISARGQRLDV